MRSTKLSVLSAGALLLSGCGVNGIEVQWDYAKSRDKCQLEAETRVSNYASRTKHELDGKERNARLVNSFNECMMGNNWDLGKPKDVATASPAGSGGGIIDTAKTKPDAVPEEKTETPPPVKSQNKLENAGVGVGVGPTYQLIRKPAPEGWETMPESSAPAPSSVSGPLSPEDQKRVLQMLREGP